LYLIIRPNCDDSTLTISIGEICWIYIYNATVIIIMSTLLTDSNSRLFCLCCACMDNSTICVHRCHHGVGSFRVFNFVWAYILVVNNNVFVDKVCSKEESYHVTAL